MGQIRDIKLLKRIAIVLKQLRETKPSPRWMLYNDTNIHLGRIETANANLSISTLSALCNFYGIRLSEFFLKTEKQ